MRKTKLTPEMIEEAVKLARLSLPNRFLAMALGIAESTFYEWMSKGEKAKGGIYKQFYDEIKRAEAQGVARKVSIIEKEASEGNWQAAAWLLERRFPNFFGRKFDFSVGSEGEDIRIVIERVNSGKADSD